MEDADAIIRAIRSALTSSAETELDQSDPARVGAELAIRVYRLSEVD